MSCEKKEIVSRYLADLLDGRELSEFEEHLEGCDECRGEVARYRKMLVMLGNLPEERAPLKVAKEIDRAAEKHFGAKRPIPVTAKWSATFRMSAAAAIVAAVLCAAYFVMNFPPDDSPVPPGPVAERPDEQPSEKEPAKAGTVTLYDSHTDSDSIVVRRSSTPLSNCENADDYGYLSFSESAGLNDTVFSLYYIDSAANRLNYTSLLSVIDGNFDKTSNVATLTTPSSAMDAFKDEVSEKDKKSFEMEKIHESGVTDNKQAAQQAARNSAVLKQIVQVAADRAQTSEQQTLLSEMVLRNNEPAPVSERLYGFTAKSAKAGKGRNAGPKETLEGLNTKKSELEEKVRQQKSALGAGAGGKKDESKVREDVLRETEKELAKLNEDITALKMERGRAKSKPAASPKIDSGIPPADEFDHLGRAESDSTDDKWLNSIGKKDSRGASAMKVVPIFRQNLEIAPTKQGEALTEEQKGEILNTLKSLPFVEKALDKIKTDNEAELLLSDEEIETMIGEISKVEGLRFNLGVLQTEIITRKAEPEYPNGHTDINDFIDEKTSQSQRRVLPQPEKWASDIRTRVNLRLAAKK